MVPEPKPAVKIVVTEPATTPTDLEGPGSSHLDSTFTFDRPNPSLPTGPVPVRERKLLMVSLVETEQCDTMFTFTLNYK